MNPKIAGFRTRAQLGMRSPRSRSTNITPQHGGVAVHWGGPSQSLGSHARCEQIWRAWQNYHMDRNGWVDIAYTAAFCNHGYVLAGRGYGTRTAANGTNSGNQNYYAFVWIGGQGDSMTTAAVNALEWLVQDARSKGAGRRVRPHQDFTGSSCPGNSFISHARRLDNTTISGGTSPAKEDDMAPKDWDKQDIAIVRAVINDMVVKHTELNLAWHVRNIQAHSRAANEGVRAVARVVDSIAARDVEIDAQALAKEIAAELGESLEDIAKQAGKAASEVTASEIVAAHAKALMDGVSNEQ